MRSGCARQLPHPLRVIRIPQRNGFGLVLFWAPHLALVRTIRPSKGQSGVFPFRLPKRLGFWQSSASLFRSPIFKWFCRDVFYRASARIFAVVIANPQAVFLLRVVLAAISRLAQPALLPCRQMPTPNPFPLTLRVAIHADSPPRHSFADSRDIWKARSTERLLNNQRRALLRGHRTRGWDGSNTASRAR